MKKLLLVSLLFVQGLWAAAAADGGAQQIIKFKAADGQIVTYQAPGFSEMINTMVKDLPASDPNEIVDLPGLTGAAFELVLDLCGEMESNNGLFKNVLVGVINNNQNMLDHLIQAAYVLRITVGLEHFIEALSIAWLNANHTASIIVVQNGRQACEKIGIGTGAKGKNLEQLTVDISRYVGPDTPINNFHLRPGTIAHLIHTNRMPAIANALLDLSNRGLTVCDVWSIHHAQRQDIGRLFLNDNQMTAVQANAFAGLSTLTFLALTANLITDVAADTFTGLPSLNTLYLDYNKIKAIAANAFEGLNNLTTLWLNDNLITAFVPGTFAGLNSLAVLLLHENEITVVEPNMFAGLPGLKQLLLRDNPELKLHNPDNLAALRVERPEWFSLPVGVGD